MFSRHTHGGGQIRPLGHIVRLVSALVNGDHGVNGMKIIVSRGARTWGPRMRLWRPARILAHHPESDGADFGAASGPGSAGFIGPAGPKLF